MKRRKRAAALAVAAVLACGALAGCDSLITTDVKKDYRQVVATVDISTSADFAEGGTFAAYKDVIEPADIIKRDMVASFVGNGYNLMQSYGWSYADTFNTIMESLVNRQVFLQYCMVYLFGAQGDLYTAEGYKAAKTDDVAAVAYFLTQEERDRADYSVRVSVNNTLDTAEEAIIDLEDTEHEHGTVRTLPTGVNTENEDYYASAAEYKIYTGTADTVSEGYERVEGSTASTRKAAYRKFLSNLRSNDLIEQGENTADVESLSYFKLERKSAYEDALINKVVDLFEKEAEANLTEAWSRKVFDDTVAAQQASYANDRTSFESTLDGMSDTSFVLAAPDDAYGFVINILLPFSTMQTEALNNASNDREDVKGNKFAARAQLLSKIEATDQRSSWITEHEDYSYVGEGYTGADAATQDSRDRLFFEDAMTAPADGTGKYEPIKNYYGKYTFNGKVEAKGEDEYGHTEYDIDPYEIDIDGFLAEMRGYLTSAGFSLENTDVPKETYYADDKNYYKADGSVDYSQFVYASGKIAFDEPYDANRIFERGSEENKAFSIINELSFAYNTDTAGLNSYLGYMISPYTTTFMKEFEYAAQWAVAEGAGSYCVVPTDYGWHIIYCTFSFKDVAEGKSSPFDFVYADREKEGTFSYNYFEALKSTAVDSYAANRRTAAINEYADSCATIYEDRFADLTNLGN